jgi:hypothetical protein
VRTVTARSKGGNREIARRLSPVSTSAIICQVVGFGNHSSGPDVRTVRLRFKGPVSRRSSRDSSMLSARIREDAKSVQTTSLLVRAIRLRTASSIIAYLPPSPETTHTLLL